MTTTTDKKQLPAEARRFGPRRFYLVVGVLCGVFFSVMGVASTLSAYWNIDGSFPQPKLAALIFGIGWSCFTLLAVWIILVYFRERLYLANKTIIQNSVIRSRTIHSEDVVHVNWRRWPAGGSIWRRWPAGGSIVVQTPSAKIKIGLGNLTKEEREEIIRFFRETFASELQDNWLRFEDRARRLSPPQRLVSRGGIIVTASVLMGLAGVFVYCWFAGLGGQYLFIGVVNAAAALCCLWRLRTYKDYGLTEESGGVQERPE
jgi:hypothetical protein